MYVCYIILLTLRTKALKAICYKHAQAKLDNYVLK